MRNRRWARSLAMWTVVALALWTLATPGAIAAGTLTKKEVKQIATKVVNSKIHGIKMWRFFDQANANTTDQVIGKFGPITLKASCDGAGEPTLRASWSMDVNHMTFNGASGSQFGNATVPAGSTISIGSGQFGSVGLAEAVGIPAPHVHTSVEFFLRDTPALGADQCFFSGFVTVE